MPTVVQTRLRKAREAKFAKAADFARAMGVGRSTVSMWEHGTRTLSVTTAAKIARLLEQSMDSLFSEREDS